MSKLNPLVPFQARIPIPELERVDRFRHRFPGLTRASVLRACLTHSLDCFEKDPSLAFVSSLPEEADEKPPPAAPAVPAAAHAASSSIAQ